MSLFLFDAIFAKYNYVFKFLFSELLITLKRNISQHAKLAYFILLFVTLTIFPIYFEVKACLIK